MRLLFLNLKLFDVIKHPFTYNYVVFCGYKNLLRRKIIKEKFRNRKFITNKYLFYLTNS